MSNPFLDYASKYYLQFINVYYLLIFLKLNNNNYNKIFSMQNCDLKFTLWIELINLCAFTYVFGNFNLFREWCGVGVEITYALDLQTRLNGPCVEYLRVNTYVKNNTSYHMLIRKVIFKSLIKVTFMIFTWNIFRFKKKKICKRIWKFYYSRHFLFMQSFLFMQLSFIPKFPI